MLNFVVFAIASLFVSSLRCQPSPTPTQRLGLFRTPPPLPPDRSLVLLASGSACDFFNKANLTSSDWYLDPQFAAVGWDRVRMPIGNSTRLVNSVIRHVTPPGAVNYVRVNFTLSAAQLARTKRFGMLLQVSTITQAAVLAINHNVVEPIASGTGLGARYWNAERHLDSRFLVRGNNVVALAADIYANDTSLLFIDVQILIDTHLVALSDVFAVTQPLPNDAWRNTTYNESLASGVTWTSVIMPVATTQSMRSRASAPTSTKAAIAARRQFSVSAERLSLFGSFVVYVIHEDPFKVFVNGVEVLRESAIVANRLPLYFNGNASFGSLRPGLNLLALECSDFHSDLGYCGIVLEGVPDAALWAQLDPSAPTAPQVNVTSGDNMAPSMAPFNLPLVVGIAVGAGLLLIAVIVVAIVWYRHATRETDSARVEQGARPANSQYQQIAVRDASMQSVRASMSLPSSHADYQQITLTAASDRESASIAPAVAPAKEAGHSTLYEASSSMYDRVSRTTSALDYDAPPLGTHAET
jgi:hypothetical protein